MLFFSQSNDIGKYGSQNSCVYTPKGRLKFLFFFFLFFYWTIICAVLVVIFFFFYKMKLKIAFLFFRIQFTSLSINRPEVIFFLSFFLCMCKVIFKLFAICILHIILFEFSKEHFALSINNKNAIY